MSSLEQLSALFKGVPIIQQSEMAECGLACLAMVLGYHGHNVTLMDLRQHNPLSLRGMDLSQIVKLATTFQLAARPLRLEVEEISQLAMPCILHWDLNHFVVLRSVRGKKITVHDPAVGRRVMTSREFAEHFTGVALELTPLKSFIKNASPPSMPLSSLWSHVTGLKRSLFQILCLSFCLQCFGLVSPFYLQWVVDEVVVSKDQSLLAVLALGFFLLSLMQLCITALRSWALMWLSSKMSVQLGVNVFHHLIRLPLPFFEKRSMGDIVSRFHSLDAIEQLLTTGMVEILMDGLMAIVTVGMMFFYAPSLAIIVLITVVLYALVRWSFFTPLRGMHREHLLADASQSSLFMESVRAIQTLKIFGKEDQRQQYWHQSYTNSIAKNLRVSKLKLGFSAINGFLFGLENILVVYFAAGLVMKGSFSVGMLFAFMSYKNQFTTRASDLIESLAQFKMLNLQTERLSDIVLTPTELDHRLEFSNHLVPLVGSLELRNVGFKYAENEPYVFQNINFQVEPGTSVALVGPSGCGKTTLLKCIMSLFEPTEGQIYLDGSLLDKSRWKSYRHQIAAVMQEDTLLSGTIAENIVFFDEEVDEASMHACAKAAAVHDTIMSMPMRYQSLVGEMGSTLSGGQKQRILLARALYRRPRILFLDEATSHLDVELERKINQSIKSLAITRIIIAHRPETIASVDRVIHVGTASPSKITSSFTKNSAEAPEVNSAFL